MIFMDFMYKTIDYSEINRVNYFNFLAQNDSRRMNMELNYSGDLISKLLW